MAKNSKQTYSITVIDVKGIKHSKKYFNQRTSFVSKSPKTCQNVDMQPTNLGELKEAIRHLAINMDENMIQRAFQGMIHRVNKCININGNTFSDA